MQAASDEQESGNASADDGTGSRQTDQPDPVAPEAFAPGRAVRHTTAKVSRIAQPAPTRCLA